MTAIQSKRKMAKDKMVEHYARICLDADENRVVWQVMVFDQDDNLVEMRPFRDEQDAEEYAELIGLE